jgi:glutamine amidotransferase
MPESPKSERTPQIAIVDFDLGNLFSVAQACRTTGIAAAITNDPLTVGRADALILPGVGSFPKAMDSLTRRGLISPIMDAAAAGKPIIGICLGMQLLMQSSSEFGATPGLGLIEGSVGKLPDIAGPHGRNLPIPNVGWSPVAPVRNGLPWRGTPLGETAPGAMFYFVHSFFVKAKRVQDELASTAFGTETFCAAVGRGNIFGMQFHPERSGAVGLNVYRTIDRMIRTESLARA